MSMVVSTRLVSDGVRFLLLLLYKYSLGSVFHLIVTAPLGEERNFGVSGADSSYLVTLGPRGLWSSMRHLDYCGVWSPGEYFRVRTSLFHCRDFDILDAHSNIFSTCHLSRFLLSPCGQWTRAVCSTNAEVRLKTETRYARASTIFFYFSGAHLLDVCRSGRIVHPLRSGTLPFAEFDFHFSSSCSLLMSRSRPSCPRSFSFFLNGCYHFGPYEEIERNYARWKHRTL